MIERSPPPLDVRPLSPRETEVARLVSEDLADKEIANILRIRIRTVHEYLDRIGKKLGIDDAMTARRRAIRAWVVERDRLSASEHESLSSVRITTDMTTRPDSAIVKG